jgi:hypothetical protein
MKSIPSQQAPKKGIFSKAQAHHKWLFTPITCTKLSYVGLELEDFSSFWDLMRNDWKLEEYLYDHYLDLGDFLYSWWEHRKNNNNFLVGKECTPPMCWRPRLGGEQQMTMNTNVGNGHASWINQHWTKKMCLLNLH